MSAPAEEPASRPNILLVVIESFRADHAGCYGYGRDTTPRLDAVAREGVRFEQAIASSSWTLPSVASLFTAAPPSVHRVRTVTNSLSPRIVTLTTLLHQAGYQTAGIVSNPMLQSRFGFDEGFEHYDDYTVPLNVEANLFDPQASDITQNASVTGDAVTRLALSWLNGKRESGYSDITA